MADPFDTAGGSRFGAGATRAGGDFDAQLNGLRHDGAVGADPFATRSTAYDAAAASIKDQAAKAADEAKSAAASLADQARSRVAEIIDAQKAAGADKIAGVAKAAHSAAADLDKTSPQIARVVRTAAENVDRIATDVRSSDIGTVFRTLAEFGRRQPVAFFGGAVLAGFVVSRFFKSDVPLVDSTTLYRDGDPV